MKRIHDLMEALRKANECEAAAQMDVYDAECIVAEEQRILYIKREKLAEMELAAQEASEALADAVNEETGAPIFAIFEKD